MEASRRLYRVEGAGWANGIRVELLRGAELNVELHAGSASADITMNGLDQMMVLSIFDDGNRIELAAALREAAELLEARDDER